MGNCMSSHEKKKSISQSRIDQVDPQQAENTRRSGDAQRINRGSGESQSLLPTFLVPPNQQTQTTQQEVNLDKFKDDASVVKEFVTVEHKRAISTYCKKMNVIFSIRDTGKLSLDRIQEGAKPKPHTILEKSIKESSLAKALSTARPQYDSTIKR